VLSGFVSEIGTRVSSCVETLEETGVAGRGRASVVLVVELDVEVGGALLQGSACG
jgi:hypothetical protein